MQAYELIDTEKKKELINNTLIIYFWSASVNLFI